ncbi:MAG: VTT domain-containing protein [Candidatus Diapherotrites archaeon]|nr:VTT domain-containing protein [Candidatus Diapherotrites archaeon]
MSEAPFLQELIYTFGYFGVFMAVLITSLSMFVGIPTFTYVSIATALGLDPFLTSLVAAIAGALGESPAYIIGLGSKKLLERKYRDILMYWEELFKKYGFWAVVLVAAFPFAPDEIAGLLAGAARYDYLKFLLATAIGKFIKYLIAAYAGVFVGEFVINLPAS